MVGTYSYIVLNILGLVDSGILIDSWFEPKCLEL